MNHRSAKKKNMHGLSFESIKMPPEMENVVISFVKKDHQLLPAVFS